MNPKQDVITDLLPLYFSGEASADTRALVEEYFAANPDFERMARRMAVGMAALKSAPLTAADALEQRALVRTRAQLRGRNMSLGAAFAGAAAILAMIATHQPTNPAMNEWFPLAVLACVAICAVLAKITWKTGL